MTSHTLQLREWNALAGQRATTRLVDAFVVNAGACIDAAATRDVIMEGEGVSNLSNQRTDNGEHQMVSAVVGVGMN